MGCLLCKESSPPNPIYAGKGKFKNKSRRPSITVDVGRKEEVLVTKKTVYSSRPSTTSVEPRWSPASSLMTSPLEWPSWLMEVAGEALVGWSPRKVDSFQKLSKIGQGTYSNVYKAKDLITGKIVALKKVRFDDHEVESIRFMAREITLLRRLDHPNVIKLEGIVTSRVSCSLYLIFEYMEHDLAGLAASPEVDFTLPQIKCYMKQLLSGLEHCHRWGILHRDIKGSNLLIDNQGVLKIADFGLASSYDPDQKQPMTSRVVTLWYRPPELILGATHYGAGVDLWSAGCILAELLANKPILPGRTEVEQLHRIFKLCGSPSENYWKTSKFPNADMFKSDKPYKNNIAETFRDFPSSSLPVLQSLLSVEPADRGSATDALASEFFTSEPLACEPESLPHYRPSKEMDVRHRDEQSQRKNAVRTRRRSVDGKKKHDYGIRTNRAAPDPEAIAEQQINLNKLRLAALANTTSKSDKFPPPHRDGSLGFPLDKTSLNGPFSFVMPDSSSSFTSSIFEADNEIKPRSRIRRRVTPSQMIIRSYKPSSVGDSQRKSMSNFHRRERGKELEVFGSGM